MHHAERRSSRLAESSSSDWLCLDASYLPSVDSEMRSLPCLSCLCVSRRTKQGPLCMSRAQCSEAVVHRKHLKGACSFKNWYPEGLLHPYISCFSLQGAPLSELSYLHFLGVCMCAGRHTHTHTKPDSGARAVPPPQSCTCYGPHSPQAVTGEALAESQLYVK